jgi:hypothetical protein
MYIPQGILTLDVGRLKLAESIELAASSVRSKGKEDEALALFRLRTKIREGLSYEEAKPIFDKYTKNLLGEIS